MPTATDILQLIHDRGVIRARDLSRLGIGTIYLTRLVEDGQIRRIGRGLYASNSYDQSDRHSFIEIALKAPHAIISLLSALQYHGLTTQAPFEVWITIAAHARKPSLEYPPLRVFRTSEQTLPIGCEQHTIDSVTVNIYSPARTVVDCFRYRNKIGIDVAKEALRDGIRMKKCTIDDLWRIATQCRIANVIRPYLETIE